jgi:hypothetical protein
VPHQPINLSATEPAMAVVARNDANEQEHVVTYRGKKIASSRAVICRREDNKEGLGR